MIWIQMRRGAHMGQLLYRLPRDGQTDDMKASIESMIAALAAAVPASPTDTGDGLRAAIEALVDECEREGFEDIALATIKRRLAAHGGDA